jgi:hypothetical protein
MVLYIVHNIPNVGDTQMHGAFSTPAKAWAAIEKLSERKEIVSKAPPDANGTGAIWVRSLMGNMSMFQMEAIEVDKLYLA